MGQPSMEHPIRPPETIAEPLGADARARRQYFYNALLTCDADRAEDAFDDISKAWSAATLATMAGLWLYNAYSQQFELNGLAVPEPLNPFSAAPQLATDSISYLAQRIGRPLYVHDVRNWSTEHEGERYRVVIAEPLAAAGFSSAIYVPLNGTRGSEGADASEHVAGVVSLHFQPAGTRRWPLPKALSGELDADTQDSLLLMSNLTALLIAKLRLRQQAEIGDQLARLAGEHLTRAKDDPRAVRHDYLTGVLQILESELRIRAASVWWRHPFERSLSCLISMGGLLRVRDGKPLITKSEIADAEYNPREWDDDREREAWTYRAFRTGRHQLWVPDSVNDHQPTFRDLVDGKHEGPSPVLLVPIHAAAEAPLGDSEAASLGVIRCAHRPSVLFKDARTTFDIVEVRLLEFIVHQIAPVLHALEARILREDAIRVIKHDMAALLGSIRDNVNELDQHLPAPSDDLQYALRNLHEGVMSTSGLIDRLARDVEVRIRVEPRKVDLGTQLMPRIKRLLTPFAETESGMDIRFEGFEYLPPLNVDPTLVERALYNLIVNAVKYGERGSTIQIQARSLPEGYAIDVANRGPGVREEDVPNLFRMYFRSRYVRGEGSGLGLAIVRQIMRSHDGQALLERSRGPTVFRLLFPPGRAAISRRN